MENQIKLPREQAAMPDTMRRQVPDPLPKTPAPNRPQPPSPIVDPIKTASARRAGPRSLSSAKNRVKGSLAVRGEEDNVDALATPEGKYAKAVRDVINPIWNARLAGVSGLAGTGVVEVEFDIDMQGRVSNARLLNPDGASAILNDVCLSAITGAKLPAPPEELRKEMADPLFRGKLRRRFSFYRL
jgi:outer membrane biosynthesis protein TonB